MSYISVMCILLVLLSFNGNVMQSSSLVAANKCADESLAHIEEFREEVTSLLKELNDTFQRRFEQVSSSLCQKPPDTINAANVSSAPPLVPDTTTTPLPLNCKETTIDGIHTLRSGEEVVCDDGWRVFQRRYSGTITDFHSKTWEEYAKGFGRLRREFWLGLRKLHQLTGQGGCRLRVDLFTFRNEYAYADYSQFRVADEGSQFRVTLSGYNGTAGDSLTPPQFNVNINGMAFTTKDRDNDRAISINCASQPYNLGGWWHNSCGNAFPTAKWGKVLPPSRPMMWLSWKRFQPLKSIVLKIRCNKGQ